MNILRFAALLLTTVVFAAQAESFILPGGMTLEPDASLDLTYQVIPGFDENSKVVAGWSGDKLQYFLTLEKLPSGWLDSEKYFTGLVRDLRAAGRAVETGRQGDYKTRANLSGAFIEILTKPSAQAASSTQVAHFLTDGNVSFVAVATLIDKSGADRMLAETTLLFKSAALSGSGDSGFSAFSAKSNESPFFGTWQSNSLAPNGRPMVTTTILKDDLSFVSEISLDGKRVFSAVGVWSVKGKQIYWTYVRSNPPLPDNNKEDEDEIVSFAEGRLVLRSKLSGKEHEFVRN